MNNYKIRFENIICSNLTEESEEDNINYFDYSSFPANQVYVYNGIDLCAQCVGEHRYFGPSKSDLKFLQMN